MPRALVLCSGTDSVGRYLQEQGYRIIPVNPTLESVLGERCYPDLKSVPERVDMVDIFRRSEHVGPIVDDAIAIGAKYVWMQDGVVDHDAAARAREGSGVVGGHGQLSPARTPPPVRWRGLMPEPAWHS